MQHDPYREDTAGSGGHVERGNDQVSALRLTRGVSQDPTRVRITRGAQVAPALRAPQIGEIRDPYPIQGALIPQARAGPAGPLGFSTRNSLRA